MYLYKNRNSSYYSRICFPKSLQKSHCLPREIRFSLNTKSRPEAIERNFAVAAFIKKELRTISSHTESKQFICHLKAKLEQLRSQLFTVQISDLLPVSNASHFVQPISPELHVEQPNESNEALLERFLNKKRSEDLTIRSVKQLETRIGYFLQYLESHVSDLTVKTASNYRDHLMTTDKSLKSKKEYLSAVKQFINWLVLNEILVKNDFAQLKVKQDPLRSVADERRKWSVKELTKLFKHPNFSQQIGLQGTVSYQKKLEDYWIPLILLHTGARASEICQLRTQDVVLKNGIWCFDINDKGEGRRLKTASAKRVIPIHTSLIQLGFIDYVQHRKQTNQLGLFSIKPIGIENSWSAQFGKRFMRVLKDIGLTYQGRPSLHSLRHTMINKAQAVGLHENEIASLVGHSKGLTYGRYGKEVDINRLSYVINKLDFSAVLVNVKNSYVHNTDER